MRKKPASNGMTLLEILVAMLILALVASGMFGAFYFARQVSYRSEATLIAQGYAQRIAEQIRASMRSEVTLPLGSNDVLPLTAGVYLDPDYDDDPATAGKKPPSDLCAEVTPTWLDGLPADSPLRVPDDLKTKYNLRWRYYVETHDSARTQLPCEDPPRGINFNPVTDPPGPGQDDEVDLTWTDIKVDWNPPRS